MGERVKEVLMKPYSPDLRIRVVNAYANKEGSMRRLAKTFHVSVCCVRDLLTRYRQTGSVVPKPHGGGYPAKVDAEGLHVVQVLIQAAPDATLRELCQRFKEAAQVSISLATMSRALKKRRFTRKKNVSRHRARKRSRPAEAS
jgi:transposase